MRRFDSYQVHFAFTNSGGDSIFSQSDRIGRDRLLPPELGLGGEHMAEQQDNNLPSSGEEQRLGKFLRAYGPYLLIAAVAVILIILVIVSVNSSSPAGNGGGTDAESEQLVVNSNVPDELETFSSNLNVIGLERDAYPEINELIEKYFDAVLARDVETLNKIVESDHRLTEDEISKSGEYIEDYQNISCYTMKGLLDNTYIVYVYYEVKLLNIETAAPSLVRMYVCRNSEGSVYIYNGSISDEMEAYAEQMDNNEDVRILVSEVNKSLKTACDADADLEEFYNRVLNETNVSGGTTEQTDDTEAEDSSEAGTDAEDDESDGSNADTGGSD